MKLTSKHTALWVLGSGLLALASCTMMEDDRTDCPDCRNPLRVSLRYDYNTARANMFCDHVQQATAYVVDAQTGIVVEQQTTQNTATAFPTDGRLPVAFQPLRNPSFAFNFEGLAPGRYRLYATGRSAADQPLLMTAPKEGEPISKLQFALPTDGEGQVPALRLDTVWNTLKPVDIEVPEREPAEATVPLMRLTNDLSIILFRRDTPSDICHEQYEVTVSDSVGYHPFAQWTTETLTNGGTLAERHAHYDLSLGRLVSHDDARRNARLIIRNRATGHEVTDIDLCYHLALARNAYEYQHYGIQEYLDREYDYRLDFGLEGTGDHETWRYMTIHIGVLSWALRIQNEEL
ncbi:MAG: FimB/Mfa2 family fimbrial subunit [Prevotella sp.]|nr:FimB/Mfa2 family fimbrial subunit [Prevotella sp.]